MGSNYSIRITSEGFLRVRCRDLVDKEIEISLEGQCSQNVIVPDNGRSDPKSLMVELRSESTSISFDVGMVGKIIVPKPPPPPPTTIVLNISPDTKVVIHRSDEGLGPEESLRLTRQQEE